MSGNVQEKSRPTHLGQRASGIALGIERRRRSHASREKSALSEQWLVTHKRAETEGMPRVRKTEVQDIHEIINLISARVRAQFENDGFATRDAGGCAAKSFHHVALVADLALIINRKSR